MARGRRSSNGRPGRPDAGRPRVLDLVCENLRLLAELRSRYRSAAVPGRTVGRCPLCRSREARQATRTVGTSAEGARASTKVFSQTEAGRYLPVVLTDLGGGVWRSTPPASWASAPARIWILEKLRKVLLARKSA